MPRKADTVALLRVIPPGESLLQAGHYDANPKASQGSDPLHRTRRPPAPDTAAYLKTGGRFIIQSLSRGKHRDISGQRLSDCWQLPCAGAATVRLRLSIYSF